MVTKIFTTSQLGLEVQLIECEIDLTPAMPGIIIVGLPDKAVQESRERIRSAIKQSGFEFPLGKITVNLAPADLAKSGSAFDLPIAVGILNLTGQIYKKISSECLFIGELALDGALRPVNGVLSICLWAKKNGYKQIFLPKENQNEAALVENLESYGVKNLQDIVDFLNGKPNLKPIPKVDFEKLQIDKKSALTSVAHNPEQSQTPLYLNDLAYVRGQEVAKRALEIGASGGHNILFIGQPGSGKTLLARSYSTILPSLTSEEMLEITQIYSSIGFLKNGEVLLERPFRSPHHSSSYVSIIGGGAKLRPGEVSLAHRGVLFLDEFPEFSREAVEALRQPLEDGFLTISRASGTVTYPSRFYLLAAANPTPSGFNPEDPEILNKPQSRLAINRYQAKFSGPILDRIDIQVDVNKPQKEELQSTSLAEPSITVALRVQKARNIQTERFLKEKIHTNAEMNLPLINKYCGLDSACKKLIDKAIDRFHLSARGYMRILKLSRTIADLAQSKDIKVEHLAESLQYRGRFFNT